MKVAIDARALGSQWGGDETYIRNVIRALAIVDPDGDYSLFFGQPLPRSTIPGTEHMRRVVVRPIGPFVPMHLSFPLALTRWRIDVVHVQYMTPLLCPV